MFADKGPKSQLFAITWFALGIAMVVNGGGGKHLYDVTYLELNWYYRVCTHSTLIMALNYEHLRHLDGHANSCSRSDL